MASQLKSEAEIMKRASEVAELPRTARTVTLLGVASRWEQRARAAERRLRAAAVGGCIVGTIVTATIWFLSNLLGH